MAGPPEQKTKHRGAGFAADLVPGLTTAAVVVPKALAYATIAQLPAQAGLFAALVPMAIYAVLGSSRLLSVSTTTPIAILCATAIGEALRSDPGPARWWLAALNPETLELVRRTPLAQRLGRERMYTTVEQALAAFQARTASPA